jgi:hypothetical protein
MDMSKMTRQEIEALLRPLVYNENGDPEAAALHLMLSHIS